MGEGVPSFGRTKLHYAVIKGDYADIITVLQNIPDKDTQDITGQTPLHLAAHFNRSGAVKLLLGPPPAKVDVVDRSNKNALHIAAHGGCTDIVQQLLDSSANLANAPDKYKQTPLHVAAGRGFTDVVKKLLQRGAKPEIVDKNNRTPLHLAAQNGFKEVVGELLANDAKADALDEDHRTALHLAAINGHHQVVKQLLGNTSNSEVKDMTDKYGQPPIYYAAFGGHECATNVLKEAKAKMEIANGQAQTLLYQLASTGNEKAVRLLIDGADINAKDIYSNPPLYAAAKGNHRAIVQFLAEQGADKYAKDDAEQTILHRVAGEGSDDAVRLMLEIHCDKDATDKMGQTPLYVAATNNRKGAVHLLVNDNRARLDAKDNTDRTLLHRAALEGHVEAVDLLAGEKANLELLDSKGRSPLYVAAESNNGRIVEILRNKYRAETETKDNNGQALLHRAAREGNEIATNLLLRVGADRNAKDNNGQTPLHTAANHGVMLTLIRYEADVNMKDNMGQTPLHMVATRGDDVNMLELLITKKTKPANLELLDSKGRSPLYVAAESNNKRIVKILHDKYSAKTETKDNNGQTLLHRAAREGNETATNLLLGVKADKNAKDNNGQTPLHIAASHASGHEVMRSLIKLEADVNIQDNMEQTPLHVIAARGDDVNMLELLIKEKAKPATTDINGQSPLHVTAARGDVNMVTKLLGVLAVKQTINSTDNNGQTPMHVAAKYGRREVVLLLRTNGASKDVQNNDGEVLLHTAARYGKSQVVEYLRDLPGWEANRAARDKKGRSPLDLAILSGDQATIDMFLPYSVPSPKTPEEYDVHYRQFAADNLAGVFSPGDPRIQRYAAAAAAKASSAARMWGLEEEDVPGLANLWLYDFVVLCDDSGSMKNYPRRIDALNDTLQRAASVATVLEPSGIYVRLLNYPRDEDGGFDHMTDANTIVRKVKGAYQEKHDIYTRLGTVLQKKIVRPLVDDKIAKREFNKPLLVYIITDGMPEGEPENAFENTIRKCKVALKERGIGTAAVIFIVSQVGNSGYATRFLEDLENKPDLREVIYCSKGKLDEILMSFQNSPEKFTAWVVKRFVEAVKSQSVSRC